MDLDFSEGFIGLAAEIGVLLLLLSLGLEYNSAELRNGLSSAGRSGLIDGALNFSPGFLAGLVLGWGPTTAALLGGVTWISSSGVISKVLTDFDRLGNRETPAVLNLLVIEDLAMAVYLPVVAAVIAGTALMATMLTVGGAVLVVALILAVALRWGGPISELIASESDEALVLAVFGITLLVAGLAQQVDVSAAVGAFLVGLALSGTVQERAGALVLPLRDLFAATFFFFFSFQLDPAEVFSASGTRRPTGGCGDGDEVDYRVVDVLLAGSSGSPARRTDSGRPGGVFDRHCIARSGRRRRRSTDLAGRGLCSHHGGCRARPCQIRRPHTAGATSPGVVDVNIGKAGGVKDVARTAFDEDTALEPQGPNRWSGIVSDRWDALSGRPNGGYLLALALTGLEREAAFPDPLALSCFYQRPAQHGPFEMTVEIVRTGKTVETRQVVMSQNGKEVLRAIATLGDLGSWEGRSTELGAPPDLPPPDECDDYLGGDSPMIPITNRFDYRAPRKDRWSSGRPTGDPTIEAWMRLRDGREPDSRVLALVTDAVYPSVFELGGVATTVTLELTAHFRARPAPGWMAVRASTRHVRTGYAEEDFEIWDSSGTLVCQSRQLARLIEQAS